MIQHRELVRQHQILINLFSRVSQACGDDIELRSHWSRYLCVLASGFIENCMKEILGSFIRGNSSSPVAKYAANQLGHLQNPKSAKVLEIVGLFKTEWRTKVEGYMTEDGRGDAIDSIMSNRNQIAHGERTSITIARVRDYFDKATDVMAFLEAECKR